jgi:D-3-phosphoglycerate dehydrogenase / 2-oxoglutarate reductase
MKILVAEPLAPAGIEMLRAQSGWDVVVADPKTYAAHLADSDALLVRSAVKVNKDVLAQAPRLRVIGRAGVGVDNVDLGAATAAGVLVMNTPGGNAVSVAEHTLALMLSLARSIPAASASTTSGKWEKKKFMGNELRGKTLGVIGLGSIGREVVKRALAFEMRILAADPYVSSSSATDLHVDLVDLAVLYAESDYITLHMALTPETTRMLNAEAFAQMKTGVRIVNCARGELIDGAALAAALHSGKVGGAALDVFDKEPLPEGHPLLSAPHLVATPHIGGSTEEAQEIVGIRIVEQLVEYLNNGIAINAVNMPALSPEQYRSVGPYITLAERLGMLASRMATGNPSKVSITYTGRIAQQNTSLVRASALAGVLARSMERKPNLVNAMQLAASRGLNVAENHLNREGHLDSITVELESDGGSTAVEGAVVLGSPRLMCVDGIYCEANLTGHMTLMQNLDVPGVIGHVGTVLGNNGINIANFSLGRQQDQAAPATPDVPRKAIAVVETDCEVSPGVIAELRINPAVQAAKTVFFE